MLLLVTILFVKIIVLLMAHMTFFMLTNLFSLQSLKSHAIIPLSCSFLLFLWSLIASPLLFKNLE